jgi:hypothetical protein
MHKDTSNQIYRLSVHPGWKELVREFYLLRERTIEKGIKARDEVKKTEMWAELAGVNKSIKLLEAIENYEPPKEEEHSQEA